MGYTSNVVMFLGMPNDDIINALELWAAYFRQFTVCSTDFSGQWRGELGKWVSVKIWCLKILWLIITDYIDNFQLGLAWVFGQTQVVNWNVLVRVQKALKATFEKCMILWDWWSKIVKYVVKTPKNPRWTPRSTPTNPKQTLKNWWHDKI